MAFLRPLDKRNLEPRSSYIKSWVLSLNQVTFYFLLCCPPWHLIQDTSFPLHYLCVVVGGHALPKARSLHVPVPATHPCSSFGSVLHTLKRRSCSCQSREESAKGLLLSRKKPSLRTQLGNSSPDSRLWGKKKVKDRGKARYKN